MRERIKRNRYPLTEWTLNGVGAGLSNVILEWAGHGGFFSNKWPAIMPCRITAIGIRSNTITAGIVTVQLRVNGLNIAGYTAVLNIGENQKVTIFTENSFSIVQGDYVQIVAHTSVGQTPTPLNIRAYIEITEGDDA